MNAVYPAIYRDVHGEERTQIENDGNKLHTTIREVELVADDPDNFNAVETAPADLLARLPLHFGDLCSYTLSFDIPIHVIKGDRAADGLLRLNYDIGGPKGDGTTYQSLEHEYITGSLVYDDMEFATSKNHGYLENAITEIQTALPTDVFMKICLNCAFGLESEAGCGGFATLGCFRDKKDEARQARSIFDVCRLWDRKTEFVQGVHVCPQFEKRSTARP